MNKPQNYPTSEFIESIADKLTFLPPSGEFYPIYSVGTILHISGKESSKLNALDVEGYYLVGDINEQFGVCDDCQLYYGSRKILGVAHISQLLNQKEEIQK